MLETVNVNLILPWVQKESEQELKYAFERTLGTRRGNTNYKSRELADLWFFETSVRLHRQGEGAPYTRIKPSGTLESLAVPMADEAIETENPEKVIDFLTSAAKEELYKIFWARNFEEDIIVRSIEKVSSESGCQYCSIHLEPSRVIVTDAKPAIQENLKQPNR